MKFIVSKLKKIKNYKKKRKTKINETTVATVPLGIVATVQNLNKRLKKKTHETLQLQSAQ